MPRGGSHGRGKKSHKGGARHFTTPGELEQQEEKLRKEKEWRKQKGYPSESEEEEEGEGDGDGEAAATKPVALGAPGELPPAESDPEEEDSDDAEAKAKGVEHLIEIENPNRIKQKTKKVTALGEDATPTQLSRREREEIEKQEARQKYQQLHQAGKTDEARADLARLAIIRKQRDDAAKKREEERKAREEAAAASKQKS